MIRGLIRQLDRSWRVALAGFIGSRDGSTALDILDALLQEDDGNYTPEREQIFAAFRETSFDSVRVVIIGQDPYPNPLYATGLAFSTDGCMPDSLKNIYKAIKSDLGEDSPRHGRLERWAEQGVFLLNRVLTFCEDEENEDVKNKHDCKEWRDFTQAVVQALTNSKRPIQFILWGKKAQEIKLPDYPESLIHRAYHPKPRDGQKARDFINCQHFSKVNNILVAMGEEPINWIRDIPAPPPQARND